VSPDADRSLDRHTIKALKECVWLLEEAVRELLIYATPCGGGFLPALNGGASALEIR
jgi:hypothetical protein